MNINMKLITCNGDKDIQKANEQKRRQKDEPLSLGGMVWSVVHLPLFCSSNS